MIDQTSDLQFEQSILSSVEAHRTDVFKCWTPLRKVIKELKNVKITFTTKQMIPTGWSEKEFQKFLNQTREYGTLLHLVAKKNQPDMVRILINLGADPNILSNGEKPLTSKTPTPVKTAFNDALFASIAQHDMAMTERLMAAGLDTDAILRDNPEKFNSPLHWAICFLNFQALNFFIEKGVPMNCTNAKGFSPLHEAVLMNNFEAVEVLIKLGVDLNFPVQGNSELKGKTAIELAAPESPIRNLISASSSANGLSTKSAEVSTDITSRGSLRGFNRPPISPGSESTFSMEEVNFTMPLMRAPVHPVVTDSRLHWLWPPPKNIQQTNKPPFSTNQLTWNISIIPSSTSLHEILDIWDIHKPSLSLLGVNLIICNISSSNGPAAPIDGESINVTCCIKAELFQKTESYRLTISSERISIICSDGPALHHALSTVYQLIVLCQEDGFIPALHIEDSPTLRMRAIFLDVSPRGRVPLLDSLFSMIDAWRGLKLNQLHLYARISCEEGVNLQWPWPYSKIEVVSLDRFCKDRGIELIPALDLEGDSIETHQLQALIKFTQSCFPTTNFFHAGPTLTSRLVDPERGFLIENGSCVWLLCANSLREKKIPSHFTSSFILVEYGFQASVNFHEKSEAAWADSQAICFCAGTASWDCLSSYPEAAAANILHAVQAAVDRGSLGSFVATWTDSISIGSLHFAWPGWIIQAGLAWNHSVHWDFIQNSLGDLISLWILNEPMKRRTYIGEALVEMGRLETWLLRCARGELDYKNGIEHADSLVLPALPPTEGGSIHYKLILDPDSVNVDHLSMESVVRAIRHAKKWHKLLTESAPAEETRYSFTKTIVHQAILTADFLLLACRILRGIITVGSNPNSNMGLAAINPTIANLPPTLRTDAANKLLSLTERLQRLFLQQYQVPSNGLNNIMTALNASIQRLLTCSDKSDEI